MNLENATTEIQNLSENENDFNILNIKSHATIITNKDSEYETLNKKNLNIECSADLITSSEDEKFNEVDKHINLEQTSKDRLEDEQLDIAIGTKSKRIGLSVLESDSDDELIGNELVRNIQENVDELHITNVTPNQEQRTDLKENVNEGVNIIKPQKKSNRIAIVETDSEDEGPVILQNKSLTNELHTENLSGNTSVYVFDQTGKLVVEDDDAVQKSRIAALCDSESSDDEYRSLPVPPQSKKLSRCSAKKSGPKEGNLPKKMSAKEALQQRQEIRSESQRTLRESRCSLPYHKPKARSIKEFLQNRPKLSLSLKTDNAPPSVAIKMTAQQLQIVTKRLEERKKAVQNFYKSESESDAENGVDEDNATVDRESFGENSVGGVNGNEAFNNKEDEVSSAKTNAEEIHELNLQGQDVNGLPDSIETCGDSLQSDTSGAKSPADNNVTTNKESTDILNVEQNICINSKTTVDNGNLDTYNTIVENNKNNLDTVLAEQSRLCEPISVTENLEDTSQNRTQVTYEERIEANGCEIPNQCENKVDDFNDSCDNSVEFDFNLDGLEEDLMKTDCDHTETNIDIIEKHSESTEKHVDDEHLQRLLTKYENATNIDECAQPAGTIERKINKLDLLKQLEGTKPRLSGGPDQEIDLDEGVAKPSGVVQLMERFVQHACMKPLVKTKVQLDIINLTQGEVVKETVAMSVEPEEERILETPGIKLKMLRDELQSQIAQRRSELWQQKHQLVNVTENKETSDDEKSHCGADDDMLDDEEEHELTDDDLEEEDEEEYDEEVVEKLKKVKEKSDFVDDEAEESSEDDKIEEFDEESESIPDSNDKEMLTSKKPLRRILKGFTEDSDDEEEENQSVIDSKQLKKDDEKHERAIKSFDSLNSTDTCGDDDDFIPPNRPRTDRTPHKETSQSNPTVLDMLTPVQQLTGLQGFESGSKSDSPVLQFALPSDPSPLRDDKWKAADVQKKLFSDSFDTLDSETNMEDIAQLCSGRFPSQTQDEISCSNPTVGSLATQDVINMCSGSFPSITQAVCSSSKVSEENCRDKLQNKGATSTFGLQKSLALQLNLGASEEIKNLDDDRLISELLDEEEMEQFKKKFQSPVAPGFTLSEADECEVEVNGGGKLISDSSDDEGEEIKSKKKRVKKLQKRLAFSDDSDSDFEEEDTKDEQEEINLHDPVSEDEIDSHDDNKVVDYDSEENEIELENQEEVARKPMKLSDFLENEAELSESDWDSADEDEKGMDALEIEKGDADIFDEDQMKNDLEKIHMRRVLDQDNREIKILQEMLLEDGELHGTGRQRQFRWKNIDNTGNEQEQQDGEIEAFLEEDESEEHWRRARHQRDMFFLKNNQDKQMVLEEDDLVSCDSNSQVFKLGQEAVRKSLTVISAAADKPTPGPAVPEVKRSMTLLNTRGSFLARTDKFLSRMAEYTKVTTTTLPGGVAKTTKNIVFQTAEQTSYGNTATSFLGNKRKSEQGEGTPTIIKKLRLSSNLTPVVKNRKKQLFK